MMRAWSTILEAAHGLAPAPAGDEWLATMLARNRRCAYLARYGSPRDMTAFRDQVPLCTHESLEPWLTRTLTNEPDVLFAGRPVACERTGGSSGGAKLIPYSAEGLEDFRQAVLPWLASLVREHRLGGRAYFSISPATRAVERMGDIPVGLGEAAYLGNDVAAALAMLSVVPPEVAAMPDVAQWRKHTLACLQQAQDLEFISVWSPTFLLALLRDIAVPARCWPRLRLVSCWADGASARHAQELAQLLPHAHIQPKGLLSTEGVATVPDASGRPVLTRHGFFEFLQDGRALLPHELQRGDVCELVMSTASGLYRYRTGDQVQCTGHDATGQPVLQFMGRSGHVSDLVGEKLTESFVNACLHPVQGYATVVADTECPGYVLVCERPQAAGILAQVEQALHANPQYRYARQMQQLATLRIMVQPQVARRVADYLLSRGTRLADVKPLALRAGPHWLMLLRPDDSELEHACTLP